MSLFKTEDLKIWRCRTNKLLSLLFISLLQIQFFKLSANSLSNHNINVLWKNDKNIKLLITSFIIHGICESNAIIFDKNNDNGFNMYNINKQHPIYMIFKLGLRIKKKSSAECTYLKNVFNANVTGINEQYMHIIDTMDA